MRTLAHDSFVTMISGDEDSVSAPKSKDKVIQAEYAKVAATRSVRELNGILYRKGRKPVSIEEMNAAIARRASRSR